MKKKYYLLLTAALLLAVSIVGSSLAATSASGAPVDSYLKSPTLDLDLSKGMASSEGQSPLEAREGVLMPGDEMGKTTFYVDNKGEVPFYVKVIVSHYWTEDGEKLIDRTTDDLKWEAGEGWMKSEGPLLGTSKESATFYYARPLNPGERVPLDAIVYLSSDMDNEYQGLGFEVTAKATAVQFVSGQNELNAAGILNTFGVIASLDGSGNILSVTE